LSERDVLQVLLFAIIFGTSLALVDEPAQQATKLVAYCRGMAAGISKSYRPLRARSFSSPPCSLVDFQI
jgi:hypothetical protein